MTDRVDDVPFAELHAKSAFSFLRATATPEALVARAVELGLRGLALVDEGSLSGAVRFIRAAEAAQLPALLGVEFEMADPAVPDRDGIVLPLPRPRTLLAGDGTGGGGAAARDGVPDRPLPQRQRRPLDALVPHAERRGVADAELGPRLALLATDERGYRSLARLLSRSNLAASKGVTRLTHALLEEHLREYQGSLLIVAPFEESEVARRLAAGDRAGARAAVERLRALGPLHLQLVDRQLPGDAWLAEEICALAARCSLPLLASAAPRSALPSERELLDALTGIRHGLPMHRLGPLRFPQAEAHLRAGAELLAAHPSAHSLWSAALAHTGVIAVGADIHLDFARVRFAGIDLPAGVSADQELARQVHAGVPTRYPEGGAELERRIAGELAAIERTGLAEFFLLCAEIVRDAHADGIAAQGRGSAGDSVIAYLLGITRVDPIRHNLIFERFLNEGRESYPDVDVDFASDRRDEVIDAVLQRFGPRHVALVCTFITYRSRSAARDVGLALGLPEALVDEGARKLEAHDPSVVGAQLAADPRWGTLLRSNISASGETLWDRWVRLCDEIDGLPRHRSMHPGGIVATAEPLDELAPVERSADGTRAVLQFDKHDIEALKLVKLDLLGLGILTAITDALDLVARDVGVRPDLDALPEEIPEVWRAVGAADTIGVFQIESRAQQQSLPRTKPVKMDDLVAQVAIIRPGPIQGNAVHPYLRRRAGLESVTYPHQSLAPILDETLGVILYQEQVMRIAIEVAGFTPGASDVFRRAMGSARSEREMELLRTRFVDGAISTVGMREPDAVELFERVAAFASFGFAKSHAAAFARTAFESVWLRLHYPAHYLAGLIRAQPMGFYPVEALIHDARRHGVTVQPVCINRSAARTSTEPTQTRGAISSDPFIVVPTSEERAAAGSEDALSYAVRLGLNLVRGVGTRTAERIVAERTRGGDFRSLDDLARRTQLPLSALERLIRAGALDAFGAERRALLWQAAEVGAEITLPPSDAPAHLTPVDRLEALIDAHGLVGADPTMQPIELWRDALTRTGTATVASLRHRAAGPARIAGLLLSRQQPPTAHGTVFLALEDETGIANVTIRARDWPRLRGAVRSALLLLVEGELQRTGEVANLVATRIAPLTRADIKRHARISFR